MEIMEKQRNGTRQQKMNSTHTDTPARLTLGVLLPHTKLYGGVKRFLELGNSFVKAGHDFIVFTPDALAPHWFDFHGRMAAFADLGSYDLDALWTTTVRYMGMVLNSNARHKIFYHVRKSEKIKALARNPEVEIYACSSNVYDYDLRHFKRQAVKAFGGVDTGNYAPRTDYSHDPSRPFVVMAYGRLAESVKGTKYVVRACERLYARGVNVKLLLYDTPTSAKAAAKIEDFSCRCPHEFVLNHPFERNSELFGRADIFVSAENPRYSGWNNTVAEAMACGVPVVSTKAGTDDLLIDNVTGLLTPRRSKAISRRILRLHDDPQMRQRLGQNARAHICRFDWDTLAATITKIIQNTDK